MPRDLSAVEIEAFFNFSDTERRVIEDWRGPALKLASALQIGFLRMTGRLLKAVRIVPSALWRDLIIKAIRQHEAELARTIIEAVDPLLLAQWRAAVTRPH